MELISLILEFIVVPLIAYLIYVDRRLVQLQSQAIKKEDLEKIYKKLDDMSNNFVFQRECEFRHK
jgi:predicted regulator of amino acid metabolism with ACT domain